MKQLAIAATEAGTLCLFDPAALPDDIRAHAYASNLDYLQALSRRGALHLVATGGEGRFLLHVYVDEPMPVDLAAQAVERSMLAAFPVPSGRVVVAGAEELSPDVATRLSRPPAPGPTIEIPPGMYAVTLYRTAFGDDLRAARLAEHVGPVHAWVLRNLGWFVVPVATSAVLTILSFFLFSLWLDAILPFLVFFSALLAVAAQLPGVRHARRTQQMLSSNYPSIVAVLRRIDILGESPGATTQARPYLGVWH
jgi:hypothetical protein